MKSRQINVDGTILLVVSQSDGSEDIFKGRTNIGYVLPNIEDGTWDYTRKFDSGPTKYGYGHTFDNAIRALLVTA